MKSIFFTCKLNYYAFFSFLVDTTEQSTNQSFFWTCMHLCMQNSTKFIWWRNSNNLLHHICSSHITTFFWSFSTSRMIVVFFLCSLYGHCKLCWLSYYLRKPENDPVMLYIFCCLIIIIILKKRQGFLSHGEIQYEHRYR